MSTEENGKESAYPGTNDPGYDTQEWYLHKTPSDATDGS